MATTPEQMLNDIGMHARSSVVHVEPKTAALWHELIGDALCGAAFEAGLAQADAERLRDARAAHMSKVDRMVAEEREACANDALVAGYPQAAARIRARGAK